MRVVRLFREAETDVALQTFGGLVVERDEDLVGRRIESQRVATFHHHLAGETAFYPNRTGLVHISGVTDPAVAVDDMLDAHRVLVDASDRLENLAQIRALLAAGYDGPFSFEPFAAEIHDLDNPEPALRASMTYLRDNV